MHAYTADQWVLFFFFYCLCGWIWESCFVSCRQRRWVNRGFLNGPLLPIYGSGALIILLFTIPVKQSLWLIFLFGMLAATALEYVTGAVMERLFKVRYWDYSTQPCNLNGYICLTSSLAWGVFSILLVRLVHPPIEELLLRLPAVWAGPLALLLTAGFTVDVVQSVHDALDLREVLTRLTEENEDLRRLAKRAEVFAAFAEEDLHAFQERTEQDKRLLQERLEAELAERRQQRSQRRRKRRELLEEGLRWRREAKLQTIASIAEAVDRYSSHVDQQLSGSDLTQRRAELRETVEKLHDRESAIRTRTAKSYRSTLRLLRANPSAKAKEFAEALEALRKLNDQR
ncbi:MAG: hypothetical protein RR350_04035 [Oscillibacter sp.]